MIVIIVKLTRSSLLPLTLLSWPMPSQYLTKVNGIYTYKITWYVTLLFQSVHVFLAREDRPARLFQEKPKPGHSVLTMQYRTRILWSSSLHEFLCLWHHILFRTHLSLSDHIGLWSKCSYRVRFCAMVVARTSLFTMITEFNKHTNFSVF